MNSVGVRSRTRPVLPRAMAAFSRRLNSGAVLTWISPLTVITWVRASTSSSISWNSGSVTATGLAYLTAGGQVNRSGRFSTFRTGERTGHGQAVRPKPGPAEGAGFEPAVRVNGLRFSRPVHSTALPPLLAGNSLGLPGLARERGHEAERDEHAAAELLEPSACA